MKLILASASPRRSQILHEAGFSFEILKMDVDESFPADMDVRAVPLYLAKKKMEEAKKNAAPGDVIITADTAVILGSEIINKPTDRADAAKMLRKLSGNMHIVISGVCISTGEKDVEFEDSTRVHFGELSDTEIDFYLDTYKPFDKAGAYAIQEWIGLNKIVKIEGNYFNVVGFPMSGVFTVLKQLGL